MHLWTLRGATRISTLCFRLQSRRKRVDRVGETKAGCEGNTLPPHEHPLGEVQKGHWNPTWEGNLPWVKTIFPLLRKLPPFTPMMW